MNILKHLQILGKSTIRTRCGLPWVYKHNDAIPLNMISGYAVHTCNGKEIYLDLIWDSDGNCIDKEKYPTRYYYDLVIRNV